MNKTDSLKNAKLFLKMTQWDVTLIKLLKISKIITTGALFLNFAGFMTFLFMGMKRKKADF